MNFILKLILVIVVYSYKCVCQTLPCNSLTTAQYDALQDFFYAMNGPSWNYPRGSTKWQFSGSPSTAPCQNMWTGLDCACDNRNFRITRIYLSNFNLVGTIPQSIGNLVYLTELKLSTNQIKGAIPSTIGQLTALTNLELDINLISGSIPSTIGNLASLNNLLLNSNQINGTIPSTIGQLTRLIIMDLFNNSLSGPIPSSIGNLSLLTVVCLSYNALSGTIPSSIGELNLLTQLRLLKNNLTGTLPLTIGNLIKIQDLDVSENQLIGTIPSTIGQFTAQTYSLSGLNFNNNRFTGSIPSSLGNLLLLTYLGLENNTLVGTIPSSIFDLPRINYFYLQNNSLTGTIPSNIGNLKSALTIGLSANQLTGTIPASVGKLNTLQYLYVGDNRLNGTIPSTIAGMTSLAGIIFENNDFSGPLPSLDKLQSLLAISFNNNRFNGTIPENYGNLKLSIIILDCNELSGTIPSSLSRLSSLLYLYLSDNNLHGSIPQSFGSLSMLSTLNLSYNHLEGVIPWSVGSMTSLSNLYLNDNRLNGCIPSSIGNLSSLQGVFMQNNYLSGSLPSSLGNIQNLTYLWLYSNELTGSIPESFKNLLNLQELLLFNNSLTGQFFNLYKGCPQAYAMSVINVQNNLFSGSIALDFNFFPNLSTIVGTSNCLRGTIPPSVCKLANLKSMVFDVAGGNSDCSANKKLNKNFKNFGSTFSPLGLSGTLPPCLFALPFLETIHFAGNQLHGTIPSVSEALALSNLVLSNNMLTGVIPVSVQENYFIVLDLSTNRLSGTLIDSFAVSPNQSVINLYVNRLSGPLPPSLRNSAVSGMSNLSLDILATNAFGCNTNEIPEKDPNSKSYFCNSDFLNTSYYLFASVVATLVIAISLSMVAKTNASFTITHWYKTSMTKFSHLKEVRGYIVIISFIRKFTLVLSLASCLVLLPVYVALNSLGVGSIVSYQYGYIASMAYLHGIGIVIFLSIFLFVIILGLRVIVAVLKSVFSENYNIKQPILHHVDNKTSEVAIYILILVIHVINLAVTVIVNAIYVRNIITSDRINQVEFQAYQFLISLFKVIWNGVYIPYATSILSKFITLSSAMQNRYILTVVNIIIAPCIATVSANQSCFYYVIVPADPVNAVTDLNVINCVETFTPGLNQFLFYNICSLRLSTVQSFAIPPFQYSYACTTALLTTYVPVLIYFYVISGFFIPGLRLLLSFMNISTSVLDALTPIGYNPNRIRGSSVLVDIMIDMTVYMTFGTASPILGIEIGISIVIISYVSFILVGRILDETVSQGSRNSNVGTTSNPIIIPSIRVPGTSTTLTSYTLGVATLEQLDVKDSWRGMFACVDMIIFTVVTFWAWLFFDMIADKNGWENGLICSLVFEAGMIGIISSAGYYCLNILHLWPSIELYIKDMTKKVLWEVVVNDKQSSDIVDAKNAAIEMSDKLQATPIQPLDAQEPHA